MGCCAQHGRTSRCAIDSQPTAEPPGHGLVQSELVPVDDPPGAHRLTLDVEDGVTLRELVGEVGQNLKILARGHGVRASQRGNQVSLTGPAELSLIHI